MALRLGATKRFNSTAMPWNRQDLVSVAGFIVRANVFKCHGRNRSRSSNPYYVLRSPWLGLAFQLLNAELSLPPPVFERSVSKHRTGLAHCDGQVYSAQA